MEYLDKKWAVMDPDSQPGKKGGSHVAQGININLGFIINRNGVAINGHEGSDIHRFSQLIWQAWLERGVALWI